MWSTGESSRSEQAEPRLGADCVVVGAGRVGLVTALLLVQDGWQVAVIERWPARYPMPAACTIDHEALRILQAAEVMAAHSDLFEPSRGERGGYQIRTPDAYETPLQAFTVPNQSAIAHDLTDNGATALRYKGSDGRLRVSARYLDETLSTDDVPAHSFDRLEKLESGEIVEIDIVCR